MLAHEVFDSAARDTLASAARVSLLRVALLVALINRMISPIVVLSLELLWRIACVFVTH